MTGQDGSPDRLRRVITATVVTTALLVTGMTVGMVAVGGPGAVSETLEDIGVEHEAIDAAVEHFDSDELNRTQESTGGDTAVDDVEPGAEVDRGPAAFDVELAERLIEREVNELRTERGLENLSYHAPLHVAALNHSDRMRADSFIGHLWPDGTTPQDRADHAGANCATGENVARTWFDRPVDTDMGTERYEDEATLAEALVRHWADSPGHYENIVSPEYSRHAVGIVVTDEGAVWATHKFCI